ncbi:MAG: SelT/SelW/SelH family protein [Lautropia sp.]|nr:SelT/SelW/SelH family protein [Lautropia sp.]
MTTTHTSSHAITIRYCTLCHWLLRAGWMAQELLSTFGTDLGGGVTLLPDTGGVFQIHCGDTLVWDRRRDGGFPDIKTLKQRVRDLIDPARDLGHIDRQSQP